MNGQIRKRGTRKDGSTRWEARYWDRMNSGTRHQKMFRTRQEASDWLTAQQHSQLTGTHIPPATQQITYTSVADAWRTTWLDLEPKTKLGNEQILANHLLPEFGTTKISAITPQRVQAYITRLSQPPANPSPSGGKALAPGTVRNIYAALRASLNTAVRLRMIHSNPCQHVKLPRSPKEQQIILTPGEVAHLAKEISTNQRTEQYGVMVLVAAYTGLRAGELLALRRQDVDLLRGRITVSRALKDIHGRFASDNPNSGIQRGMLFGPTKSHATRTIVLPRFLTQVLNDYLSHPLPSGSSSEALIFPDTNGGPLRHNNFYRRHFKPAVLRALPPEKQAFTFHCLRHTCASLLIEQGVHARAIQEQLGHSSILVTMGTYGHLMDSAYESTASALDAAYTQSQQPDNVVELRAESAAQ